ncbi:hypothetical protein B0H16DRAFT_1764324 [Mycena metata]|uniref:Uncharacterized protein n=1 Tax=Mycena metata TaxID=1033252 RepID=A0AAD7I7X5_9AGAR|nr:hypothetical protein B0H16DRAFT_1764324 [Mycena metata]
MIMPPGYDMKIQARIPAALAALHNFIIQHDPDDRVDPEVWDPSLGATVNPDTLATLRLQGELATERRTSEEAEAGAALRDSIANVMWLQYQDVLREHCEELDSDEDNNSAQSNGAQSAMSNNEDGDGDDEDNENGNDMDVD